MAIGGWCCCWGRRFVACSRRASKKQMDRRLNKCNEAVFAGELVPFADFHFRSLFSLFMALGYSTKPVSRWFSIFVFLIYFAVCLSCQACISLCLRGSLCPALHYPFRSVCLPPDVASEDSHHSFLCFSIAADAIATSVDVACADSNSSYTTAERAEKWHWHCLNHRKTIWTNSSIHPLRFVINVYRKISMRLIGTFHRCWNKAM